MEHRPFKIYYGWWVVVACFIISLYWQGVVGFGFTALFEPLQDEFGWSYAQISVAASIRGVEVGLLAPVAGLLVDRWGPRRLMLLGAVLSGVGLLFLSRISSLVTFYAFFVVVAVGVSAFSPTVTMTSVSYWFHRRLGLATGLMHSGAGFAGLMIPMVVILIDSLGWRTAIAILGGLLLLIIGSLSFVAKRSPQVEQGLEPEGTGDEQMLASQSPPAQPRSLRLSEALRSWTFWRIGLPVMFHIMFTSTVTTHIIPSLSNLGYTRATAGVIAGVLPLVSVLGRLTFGPIADKLGGSRTIAMGFAAMCLGLAVYAALSSPSLILLVPFLLLFGVGFGGNTIARGVMIKEFYGTRTFGTIYGFVMGVAMLGHITGPLMAGWVFDTWGSYTGVWIAYAILAAGMFMLMLRVPRPQENN